VTGAVARLQPLVFPVVQVVAAGAAVLLWPAHPAAAAAAFALACVTLSFTIHVAVHEWVHQGHRGGAAAELALSAVLGLPFDGYRWHHMNHHRHENRLEDYSTTWRPGPAGPEPQVWWRYALGWPRQLARASADMREQDRAGQIAPALAARIRRQKRFLTLLFWGLVLVRWPLAVAYVAMVYVGWALSSVHNYGQHPPVEYGARPSTSYGAPLYNRLFCANGLHDEHHRAPALAWTELAPDAAAPRAAWPHLFEPLAAGTPAAPRQEPA
jgi:fatty acid desaturase